MSYKFYEKYPGIVIPCFLSDDLFSRLTKNFIDIFNSLNPEKFGQSFRNNIVVTNENKDYFSGKFDESVSDLFAVLNSDDFKSQISGKLVRNNSEYGSRDELLRLLKKSNLEIQYSIAKSGYENPIHVDTKKRVIHGLIYLDVERYTGGELLLALPKTSHWECCDQIPFLSDIESTVLVSPENNLGVLVLSTPTSYHKGCITDGERRFIYFAYNSVDNPLWKKNDSFDQGMPFPVGLFKQKHPLMFKFFGLSLSMAGYRVMNKLKMNFECKKK
jgi:hypothetical protein